MKPDDIATGASERREVGRALFGLGLLLPLLAGGNMFLALEPADAMRIFVAVAIGVSVLLLRKGRTQDATVPSVVAMVGLTILAVWWIGNLALRPVGPRAALEAQGLLSGVLLYAVLSSRPPHPSERRALAAGVLFGAVLTTVYGQYQYWVTFPRLTPLMQATGREPFLYVNANFYNANAYAAFLSATMLLAVGLVAEIRASFQSRWLSAVAGAALLVTLLLTESRSAMALLVLGAIAFGIDGERAFRQRRTWLAITLVLLVAALAARLTLDLSELWQRGLLGRMSIWQGSLKMALDHWWMGVGLGQFWEQFDRYRVTSYYTRYPHSVLLEILAELGIIGAAAFLVFLLAVGLAVARSLRRVRATSTIGRPARDLLTFSLAAALLIAHAMVDIDWHAPANPLLFFVLTALAQRPESFLENGGAATAEVSGAENRS